jgi:chromosome segregation ATPase
MGQQTVQAIVGVISLFFGALLGAAATWIILRKLSKRARSEAKSESQTEIALLNERLASVTEDLGQHRDRLSDTEAKAAELRSQLDAMRDDRAHLEERASRVPTLEAQLSENVSQLNSRQEENTRIATQFAERKVVERYVKFKRKQDEYGGDWAMAQFILATETEDEAERNARMAEILKYNEEDLAATWAVFEWLRGKAGLGQAPTRTP